MFATLRRCGPAPQRLLPCRAASSILSLSASTIQNPSASMTRLGCRPPLLVSGLDQQRRYKASAFGEEEESIGSGKDSAPSTGMTTADGGSVAQGGGSEHDAVAARARALDNSFVRCIDRELEDEDVRLDKDEPALPAGWSMHHDHGTSFFVLSRHWTTPQGAKETHTARVQLTTRDTSLDPEFDVRGEHFPFQLVVANDTTDRVVDLTCDVVEGELVVGAVRSYASSLLATDVGAEAQFDRDAMYPGPSLDETEDEVLDALQLWLSERELDDHFAESVVQQSVWIEQLEYERWLKELRTFLLA